ncbi:MAG: cytidylate kinase-like family protein [Candidatus Latescibacteria bacterium]|nr:cytidylate kinase-like family protein [Candidatus Latescibacterota bacterium]
MGAITISREYGSGGRTIAAKVAEALGYENVDKDLLVAVAREAQVPVSEVERYDEQPEHPALRVLRKFLTPGYADTLTGLSEYEWWATATVPELSSQKDIALATLDEEVYVKLTAEVITRMVEKDNVVIVGRGGQAVLNEYESVLHVRVVAPREFKLGIVEERDGLEGDAAIKHMQQMAERRKTYLKRHYNIDVTDARLYHLTVNTGLLGMDAAADLVVDAARRLGLA